MPYVSVRVAGKATAEQKKDVVAGMTKVLVDVLGKSPDSIFVVIDEVDTDNWGFKGTTLTELRQQK